MRIHCLAALLAAIFFPATLSAQDPPTKARVVEEIIARVNNQIITLSDYEKAQASLKQEVAQDCQNCPEDKLEPLFEDRKKNLLRDMIDQALLTEHAKDLGLSVNADVVRQEDQIRQQNNLPSIDDLKKAVEAQGLSWEDFEANLRNKLLTQEVIRKEIGSRISIGSDELKKYYEEHKDQFVRPEEVILAEIRLSTEGKSPDEVGALRKKAADLLARIKNGDDFAELAKRNSDGPTAKEGGELGEFQRDQLSPEIRDAVFSLKKGEITGVVETKGGFEILKVLEHYEAGLQPMQKVEGEIMNRIFMSRMDPVLRDYLSELREESYVLVKPGYVDTGAVATNTGIQETAPTPDTAAKKKKKAKVKGS